MSEIQVTKQLKHIKIYNMKIHKNRKHSNSSFTGVLYSIILDGNGRPFFRYLLLLVLLVGRAAMA